MGLPRQIEKRKMTMTIFAVLEKLNELAEKIDDKLGDRWLTMQEVSRYTGLSQRTLHRAILKGTLRVSQATGKNLFRRSWIDEWLESDG